MTLHKPLEDFTGLPLAEHKDYNIRLVSINVPKSPHKDEVFETGHNWRPYRNGIKRVADICLVLISLPGVLPVIVVLAILIALQGGRPFYYQDRIGRNGRTFRMWKFRTMIPDAKEALVHHLEADPLALAEWESTQKLKRDPRITRIGRILRKLSLDELPQFWNVLKGEMSLVGPRPMMPEQASLYPGKAYYSLRPGITGLWQVSKRNDGCFADRARFDTEYEQTVSLGTDIRLLLATVTVVLRGTGY